MKTLRWSLLVVLAVACTPPPTDGKKDAGPQGEDGGPTVSRFSIQELEPSAKGLRWLSVAKGANDKIAVAYFHDVDTVNFDVKYVTWEDGITSAPETIARVQRLAGLSLAFQSNGQPAVAYLGGGNDQSTYWNQSDAVISYRQANGTWTEQVVVRRGDEVTAGNPVSDTGFLVGLFPALTFEGATAYLAYRDCHNGQFPQQDWAGSDLEFAAGGPTSFTKRIVMAGGNDKQAYGGHTQIVLANGQPALMSDQILGSADGNGMNVLFHRRNVDGSWGVAKKVQDVGNAQLGPSFVHDSVKGFAYAVVDRTQDRLTYSRSVDGNAWTEPLPIYQSGTGGWWPSLAFDPSTHEPSIAYYVCSLRSGVSEGSCPENDDELKLASEVEGNWRHETVDSAGGYSPKLTYLSTGQRVLVYRALPGGALKIAVER